MNEVRWTPTKPFHAASLEATHHQRWAFQFEPRRPACQ